MVLVPGLVSGSVSRSVSGPVSRLVFRLCPGSFQVAPGLFRGQFPGISTSYPLNLYSILRFVLHSSPLGFHRYPVWYPLELVLLLLPYTVLLLPLLLLLLTSVSTSIPTSTSFYLT